MRTIKFRGKTCKDNVWVYGQCLDSTISWVNEKLHRSWIISRVIFNDGSIMTERYPIVKEETIGQYIGLQDKNGIEIYEGDIVKTEEIGGYCQKDVGVVRYFEDGCYFGIETPNYSTKLRFTNEEIKINDGYCTIRFTMEYEVIGNIHDNPELLKGE